MNEKTAEKVSKGELAGRKLTTNGVPSKPLPKVWNGSGKVTRDDGKRGKK
ncbi:MAG: hypothetical protein M1537_08475 [Nitrospirae bacterium]|jgi:hypothetical protein|nr:MAG: hypothetical protein D084_Lepto4C00544G0008 [Leptospirillum sp. Group IV 'UBA BS']MCL4486338.1 hypothetical protein [Nitrospirota bacterium]